MSGKKEKKTSKRTPKAESTSRSAGGARLFDAMNRVIVANVPAFLGRLLDKENKAGLIYFVREDNHEFVDSFFAVLTSLFGKVHTEIEVKDLEEAKELKGTVVIKNTEKLGFDLMTQLKKFPAITPVVFVAEAELSYQVYDLRKVVEFVHIPQMGRMMKAEDFKEKLLSGLVESRKPNWPPFCMTFAANWSVNTSAVGDAKEKAKEYRKKELEKLRQEGISQGQVIDLKVPTAEKALFFTDSFIPFEKILHGPWTGRQCLALLEQRYKTYHSFSDASVEGWDEDVITIRGTEMRNKIREIVGDSGMQHFSGATQLTRTYGKLSSIVDKEESKLLEKISRQCVCGKPVADKHCPCKGDYYCSQDCQKADWKRHKKTDVHKKWDAEKKKD